MPFAKRKVFCVMFAEAMAGDSYSNPREEAKLHKRVSALVRGCCCLLFASGLVLSPLGCASYSEKNESLHDAVRQGELEQGVQEANRLLKVRKNEDLPKKWKKNTALVLLERATLFHALGWYELSAQQFSIAEKELEFLDLARDVGGKIGQYVYSDSAKKYKLSPTEKLSLNTLNLVNYLALGDLNGAKVEAKRFTVMQNYLKDYDPKRSHSAVGSYLAGFVHEQLGRYDAALRYYAEVLEDRRVQSLDRPIRRLAAHSNFRTEALEDYLADHPPLSPEEEGATSGAGELLVIMEVGRVPYKVARRIPVGAAVGLAHTYVTGDPSILEYTATKFVVYPELEPAGSIFEGGRVWANDVELPVELVSDLGDEIAHEYEDIRARIIGAALSRMIVRAAAAEGARAGGRQAENGGAIIGALAALAVEGTLVALDRPDTRSWSLLPEKILVSRLSLPAGTHEIGVEVFGQSGRERQHFSVEIEAGGFAVINVTTLR